VLTVEMGDMDENGMRCDSNSLVYSLVCSPFCGWIEITEADLSFKHQPIMLLRNGNLPNGMPR
jgi:hypothetical protein